MRRSISRIDERYSSSLRRSDGPEVGHQLRGPLGDEVEDAAAMDAGAAPASRAATLVSMSPNSRSNTSRGIRLRRHRRRRAAPGQAVRVGARVAGIAVADGPRVVAAELERREARLPGEMLRRDLIDRDAVVDVGAGGLARVHAGQVRGGRARVVAGAVAERVAVAMARAPTAPASRRGTAPAASESARTANPAPSPFGVQSAIVMPFGTYVKASRSGAPPERCRRGEGGSHRVEQRQRDDGAHALQKRPAWQMCACAWSASFNHGVIPAALAVARCSLS